MTRDAATIGAGLAPARPARAIQPGERIHVIGVAGAGASAAALHAAARGAIVSGCDRGGPSPYTTALEAVGIELAWAHHPEHVTTSPRPDRLAVTKALTAIEPDHPELAAARAAGIPVEPWQQVIADAAADRQLVAVAGTHGKSTTAGWLTHVLTVAGRDPAAFVGALLPSSITGGPPATARQGRGDVFIVEADEYAGNFDAYRPDVIAITNIDWDHPDVFADRHAVAAAFAAWLSRVPEAPLIVNAGDSGIIELLDRLPDRSGEIRRVSIQSDASPEFIAALPLPGSHNAANAVVVAATARELGVQPEEIRSGLSTFPGVGRRLERKGSAAGVVVYDDYGHHPTAIRATISVVREREPGRRLWVAAEPLTFHRTAAMLPELAAALVEADGVAIADIWPGRDRAEDRARVTSADLARAIAAMTTGDSATPKPIEAPGDVEATAAWLADRVEPGDAVLVMGGGHSYRIADRLLELLVERPATAASS